MEPRWIKERPQIEGWYWYAKPDWLRPTIVEVFFKDHYWWAAAERDLINDWQMLWNMDGYWFGPINPPDPLLPDGPNDD